jgi:S1-C subfamily serine protease
MAKLLTACVGVLLVLTGIATAGPREPLPIKEIIAKGRKGVVRVENLDVGSPVASAGFGGGSGFVFEVNYDEGTAYAITNNHVSGHASAVGVTFWDGAQYQAELIAREPGIDIALIKIRGLPDERNLSEAQKTIVPVVLGDSDQVQAGELGVSMGSPGADDLYLTDRSNAYADFMMDQSANVNVVGGRNTPLDFGVFLWSGARGEQGDSQYATNLPWVFRMSTPINHGNSGGPLFNAYGEVIGVNTWGFSEMYGVMGQQNNFCVPVNFAKDFAFQMLQTGKFERPWLGLDIIFPPSVRSVEQYIEFKERMRPKELAVFGVRHGSPAEGAGFKRGDVIIDINGQRFTSPEDFRVYVLGLDIGVPLSFRVVRGGKQLKDPITVNTGVKRSYDSEFSV